MTGAIETELDRLMDEWDAKHADSARRGRLAQGVYASHRRRALANRKAHPLKRHRLTFRDDGLSISQLAERALVSERTIRDLEDGERGSDLTWARLARALSVRREQIDPGYVRA
jgi:DNA-binding XRE family transcriptional regulator